jgi:hypothetical protein
MQIFLFDFFAIIGVLQFGFWLWAFAITDLSGRSGRFSRIKSPEHECHSQAVRIVLNLFLNMTSLRREELEMIWTYVIGPARPVQGGAAQ